MTGQDGVTRGDAAGRMGDSRDLRGGLKRARRNYQIGTAFAVLIGYAGHEDPEQAYQDATDRVSDLLATSGPEYRRLVALAAGVIQMIALDVAESRPEPVEDVQGYQVGKVIIDETVTFRGSRVVSGSIDFDVTQVGDQTRKPFQLDDGPADRVKPMRCYCGGPEEAVYGHDHGTGLYCGRAKEGKPDAGTDSA